jgi:hypothetical protein
VDSTTRLRDLIAIVGRLIALMDKETAMLRAMRSDQIGTLQAEKTRLAGLYVGMVKDIHKHPELLTAVEQAVRGELTEAMTRFEKATTENERAINAARTANERVLKAIVTAVNARRAVGTYGNNGAVAEAPRPQRAQVLSIAVDRRF